MPIKPLYDMQLGERIVTLMAALVLVLQIAMVAQRWIVAHIRIFAAQSFFSPRLPPPSPGTTTRRTFTSLPR